VLAPQGVFRLGPEPCNSNSNSNRNHLLSQSLWQNSTEFAAILQTVGCAVVQICSDLDRLSVGAAIGETGRRGPDATGRLYDRDPGATGIETRSPKQGRPQVLAD